MVSCRRRLSSGVESLAHANGPRCNDGRDHHNRGYSLWMAGGGIKAGHVHGATDDLGFNAVFDPMHVHI